MIDAHEIIMAWKNKAFSTPELRKKAHERADICAGCPSAGKTTLPFINKTIAYCTECGCPLSAKTYSPKKSCPLNKWVV